MSLRLSSATELCELAWGDHEGYVSLSIRDSSLDKEADGYWKDAIFSWPADRAKVLKLLNQAKQSKRDVYWSPMVYSRPRRSKKAATPTNLLWADLDEADPTQLPDQFQPTAWWETSPGRYQALWITEGEPMSPEVQQAVNKKLSYAVGADKGGWDMTQVIRLPDTINHKYKDVRVSKAHVNGRAPSALDLVVQLEGIQVSGGGEAPETPIAAAALPSPESVLKKHRRRINARAKQLINARTARGDRSARLWELDCLLAESGLTVLEIVGITRATAWNKFSGRHDELVRLTTEARKAVEHVGAPSPSNDEQPRPDLHVVEDDEVAEGDEQELEPVTWREFDRDRKPVKWLVADVWGENEVGFISGLPKSYKSWISLDLAVSVATGTRFLNSFQSLRGNVILIQEEDPKSIMQERLGYIAGSRGLIGAKQIDQDTVEFTYDLPDTLHIMSNGGFEITDETWMERLVEWIEKTQAKLVILDPLSMIASGFDEFKLFDMMNVVFKPLKRVRAETQAAICVVHHHVKSGEKKGAGAMYGSVAGWAWEESALHLDITAPGKITAERFSKHAKLSPLNVEIGDIEESGWQPLVFEGHQSPTDLIDLITTHENGVSVEELSEATTLGRDSVIRHLRKLEEAEKIKAVPAPRVPGQKGRRKKLWVPVK